MKKILTETGVQVVVEYIETPDGDQYFELFEDGAEYIPTNDRDSWHIVTIFVKRDESGEIERVELKRVRSGPYGPETVGARLRVGQKFREIEETVNWFVEIQLLS